MVKGGFRAKPAKPAAPRPAKPKKIEKKYQTPEPSIESRITSQLQQRLLNIFHQTLWTSPDDVAAVQEVKGHLYNRDFSKAFGSERYLRAYALRWSASRALSYAQIFEDIRGHLDVCVRRREGSHCMKILALGGGAGAELVGLAGWLNLTNTSGDGGQNDLPAAMHIVDVADWATVVQNLADAVTTPPVLSKYASAAARESNFGLSSESMLQTSFAQVDVLTWSEETVVANVADVDLVTVMFTLNELYSTSMARTQKLLSSLTKAMRPGALLLVVDSPGSYSTVSINGTDKKYPMQWLLDHTLVAGRDEEEGDTPDWMKIVSDNSRWFRMPEGLEYPIELESMRYQIHVYKRCSVV